MNMWKKGTKNRELMTRGEKSTTYLDFEKWGQKKCELLSYHFLELLFYVRPSVFAYYSTEPNWFACPIMKFFGVNLGCFLWYDCLFCLIVCFTSDHPILYSIQVRTCHRVDSSWHSSKSLLRATFKVILNGIKVSLMVKVLSHMKIKPGSFQWWVV